MSQIPCEVYSRVVGFLRPVEWWNKGKQQEWKERRTYSVAKAFGRARESQRAQGERTGMGTGRGEEVRGGNA